MDSLGKDGRKTKYFKEVYDKKKRALLDLAEKPVKNPFGKGMITVEELIKKSINKLTVGILQKLLSYCMDLKVLLGILLKT